MHPRSNSLKDTVCSTEAFLCSQHLGGFLCGARKPGLNVSGPCSLSFLQHVIRSFHCASGIKKLKLVLVELFIQLALALSCGLNNVARIDPIFDIAVIVLNVK